MENYDVFDKYVMNYDLDERKIAFKYQHSYRVVHQAEEICRSINLDTEERDLASLIALLHDIARFRQWTNFKTFNDSESFDHGQEGVKILFDEGEIKNYKVKKEDYDIIKIAIYNHNKFMVDFNKLSVREALHSKIIRDADKLDILYSFSTNRILEIEEDDEDISDEVREEFFNHEQVLKSKMKSKNDRIIMFFGFIFDLNYDYSKQRILNEGYLDKMYNHLTHKEIFKPFYDYAMKYLKGEIKDA